MQAYQNGWSFILYLDTYDADGDRITDALEDHWAVVAPGSLDKKETEGNGGQGATA